jgi:hypothetical protein
MDKPAAKIAISIPRAPYGELERARRASRK